MAYIRSNPQDYFAFLQPFVDDLRPGATVHDFLDSLDQDGVWAGEESIVAVCRKFSINVQVWDRSRKRVIDYPSDRATPIGTIRLAFTGNHYDSVVGEGGAFPPTQVWTGK